ncbi:TRAP transporter small permease [Jiella avicenniae]|uniref:TRAP transporter small permease protein n=1 Tax=Jiella avicenniae TaxID=2907202 RepID=A0A9X1P396_9HYPH|nr:TRAP transporter small permease [Jiella avicenniae]MCE7029461.1 TRAP transporter small permease [Jiella avicenniae]
MRNVIAFLERLLSAVLIVIFTVMVLAIIWQVFARYVLLSPTVWSEELARYSMVWTTMLGSALVLRRSEHVAVTVFVDILPQPLQIAIACLRDVIVVVMGGYIAYFGFEFALRGQVRLASGIGVPMSYAYFALPVGGALIALFVVANRLMDKGRVA